MKKMTTPLRGAALTVLTAAVMFTATAQPTVTKFIDSANMDFSVKPGDDFYTYASGTWVKNNPVPAKETRWGSFNELRDFNINAVKTVLQNASADKSAPAGSVAKRVGDFYRAAMDSTTIEKRGAQPVMPILKGIDSIKTSAGFFAALADLRTTGRGAPLFGMFIGQDRKNVEKMIPQLSQGGTTLPDRDYYLKSSKRNDEIKTAMLQYVSTLFTLTGTPKETAEKYAAFIYDFEKKLAAAQWSRVEMRDPYKTYNKFAIAELNKLTPGINWNTMMVKLNIKGEDSVLVNNPSFFTSTDSLVAATPVNDLKVYLKWNVLKNSASHLSSAFVDAAFAYNQVLTGQKVQTPRWQRMSQLTDGSIGELLGQLYVKEYFKPEAKARMAELVSNLRRAFAKRIDQLDWMSAETKQKAQAKLAAFRPKIGYPDVWKNYDGLVIGNNHFDNMVNVGKWNYGYMISQLGKPVDRERWGMTPPTVNAYYNATLNEIVFPAGILQFPFFDANADDAVNYGGIGAVIGHEMSHGFDDNGSKYDADGTLRNWWTDEDRKKFDAKAAQLGKQFDAYTVLDTLHVNGKLTMGENIGDLGGLNVAYEAFKMTKQGQSGEKIDGFTPDQRFFLAWAQVWRGNILPQTAAQLILTDTHSPGPYRTIGAPVNMDAWYKAFDVKEGDKLYKKPEERIVIW
ncbi:MAG TPA: M13 family metallopeptidase [Ferruginibacter sp.]|nr:M13 family metallopeptidase [Ferruginibacter sp.]HMP19839.1 M13 family metallopeptidase [Ferruginibacter sp.]